MRLAAIRVLWMAVVLAGAAGAQEAIPLYPGAAPGSPAGHSPEQKYFSKAWNAEVVTNVTRPALLLFRPPAERRNGTAVVICPGGGFMALSIASEGTEAAKVLAARGVTAFVLKYRVAQTEGDATEEFQKLFGSDRAKLEATLHSAEPLAFADGMAAMEYVRAHARQWGVAPDRVGILGFSAGGGIASYVAFHSGAEERPAFVAAIYPGGFTPDVPVPANPPPMFLAAATDDNLGLAPASVALYQTWVAGHGSAELHMYAKGGHGFGMRKQGVPADHWMEAFTEWLNFEGFLKAPEKGR